MSRTVATDGSSYQFRVKTGNAGAQWGYAIQNNGTPTTENTSIWQLVLKDINVQFPIRTAALDDIDGLEANIVDDMLAELRAAGSGCAMKARRHGLTGRQAWAKARAAYEDLRSAGKLPATFEVVYGHAWKAQRKQTADGRAIVSLDGLRRK